MAMIDVDEWLGERTREDNQRRRELRERALYSAALLHCEVGDTMAILNREAAANDVLATAQQFYDWIAQEDE